MWNYLIYANAAGSIYMLVRNWQSLEILGRKRVWFALILLGLALSLTAVRMQIVSGALYDVCYIVGYLWLVAVLYGFLILLVIDILRIIAWAGNIKPGFIYRNYPQTKAIMFGAVFLTISVILAAGYINAQFPRATHVTIPIDRNAGHLTTLRVAMISDTHLGHIYGRKKLTRIVNRMNEHQPDMVVLVGDIFDGNPEPVINRDMGAAFNHLQTRYGVYFVNGNHERAGERGNIAIDYLASHGIQPLLDTVVLIDSSFYLAGRTDRSTRTRKTVPELLQGVDMQLPVIMLDHQPYHLEEAEHAGIDLQLSGHTHHGQLFPLNFITGKIFEQDWGFLQKGKTSFYISCGTGTWGPPVRTAGYSEVVIIDLAFNK
jgi:predicted MPP superfamily phosphohydrolase